MATKRRLSPTARAAALIVALGADQAAQVYKHLREEEVELLSLEVAKLERLSASDLQEIVNDFYGLCQTHKVISEGGILYAREILERAFGAQLAASYMNRVSNAMQTRAFDFVRKSNYKNLAMMLQNEHPQTIAFVLSYVTAEQASRVISSFPKQLQLDVIKRIAVLDSVSPEIVKIVESVLEKRFSSMISVDLTEIGGVNYVAEIMNHTDRTTERYIFDELNKTDPELSNEIRKLMFVFEDIVNLDDLTIQRVLREVDQQDLAVAIKGSSKEIKDLLLNNVSSRARENILADIEYLRNVRLRDVERAQQKIVEVIRTLEESGEIVISRGEEDMIIA
ncbi:MAG TPA: flagellar motor switch protein FliG [Clostridiales bacterium]|nr:flagellar motor switch protein FliG [Clostridiales bacterium]